MDSMYEAHCNTLEDYADKIRSAPDQCGAVFAIGGSVVGVDLFDRPETFRELFQKLLHGYALDAIDRQNGPSAVPEKADALEFLSEIATGSDINRFDAIGLGTDVRFHGPRMTGSALSALDGIVHICAFHLDQSPDRSKDQDGWEQRASRAQNWRA